MRVGVPSREVGIPRGNRVGKFSLVEKGTLVICLEHAQPLSIGPFLSNILSLIYQYFGIHNKQIKKRRIFEAEKHFLADDS